MRMTLLCTRKALKRYPWSQIATEGSPESDPPFLRWYCNAITLNRRPCALLVHEGSLFSVLLYPFHSENVQSMIELFSNSLESVLPNETARADFASLRPLISGLATQSAHDKSALGSMNEIRSRLEWHVYDYRDLDDALLSEIGKGINDNPWVKRGFSSDTEFVKQLHEFVSSPALRQSR